MTDLETTATRISYVILYIVLRMRGFRNKDKKKNVDFLVDD